MLAVECWQGMAYTAGSLHAFPLSGLIHIILGPKGPSQGPCCMWPQSVARSDHKCKPCRNRVGGRPGLGW
jgi:hypothetical protein